ncbi:MAG: site-specific integrase, partial [Vicinamibacteria bacterium]
RLTFEQLAQDYLNDYRANRRKSLDHAKTYIRRLEATFGSDRAVDITTDRVRTYITARQQEGLANATINRELAAL